MCSLVACNKNGCVSTSNGPIALKIGVDVGTRLIFASIRYETNRVPGSRDMGVGKSLVKIRGNRTEWLNYEEK